MEQIGLNVLADLFSDKISMAGNTSTDPGDQIFRGLLEKSVVSSKGASSGADERQRGLGSSAGRADSANGVGSLETAFRQVGLPYGQIKLPRSAVPELISFLEKQGFQRDEIRSLIASLSDKDGSIRMDRLLAKLQKHGKSGKESQDLVIQAKDIPLIGEALAAMGIGAGKIREIIESAIREKGELSLERLSGALSAALPGVDMKSLLPAILERFQLQGAGKAEHKIMADPDVKKLVQEFADGSGLETQKQIKEELARLMRDKGLPPQEVKNFLETLTAGYARSMAKKGVGDPEAAKKAEADAKELMEKVVLRSERKQPQEEWQERILQILQKEKGIGKETLPKNWFQEEPSLKASPADLAKSGEQKPKAVPVNPVRPTDGKNQTTPEQAPAPSVRKDHSSDPRLAAAKEAIAGDLSAGRTQKENVDFLAATKSKETVALPDPLPKIMDRMLWMIQGGEQKGRIHISPPELGRLDLDLVVKHGHLQAQLSAENPQVKELIEANLGQLKQHLADIGLVIDRFDVMIGLEQNPFSKDQAWTAGHRRGQSSRKDQDEESLEKTETAAPAQRGYSLSQVDMLV